LFGGATATADVETATPSQGGAGVLGGRSKVCTRSGTGADAWCELEIQGFPGGTVHVDVDISGAGLEYREWNLQANWREVCRASYSPKDPPRSWTCHNVPAGHLYLMAAKPQYEQAEIGLRW
jgi:hypothetical protein